MDSKIAPVVSEITDFKSLQEFISSEEGSLVELTRKHYLSLGNDLGFVCEAPFKPQSDFEFEVDMAWLDEDNVEVAFQFEFGNVDELLAGISKLRLSNAILSVLITSSKSRSLSLELVAGFLKELKNAEENFLLIDLSTERHLLL